jgi:hypothetical protein
MNHFLLLIPMEKPTLFSGSYSKSSSYLPQVEIGQWTSLTSTIFSNRTVGASLILFLAITYMIHRIWPMRLTCVLVASMGETEKLYYDAVEAGELPGDIRTEEELLR